MKVLWFTNTPAQYSKGHSLYNGGGWIESLQSVVLDNNEISLGICFFFNDNNFKTVENNTTYYPINLYNTRLKQIKHKLFHKIFDEIELNYYLKVIDDFNPDIIHVFGTENSFGLLNTKTKIPIIIQIQGLLTPCLNALFPPGINMYSNLKYFLKLPGKIRGYRVLKHNSKRELVILRNSKYIIGRTDWDKSLSSLFTEKSDYFYCSEVLREVFYHKKYNSNLNNNIFTIATTSSKASFKGFDVILKTAKLLSGKINFIWNIYGIDEYKEMENILSIKSEDVKIKFRGIVNANELLDELSKSNLSINTSYIENSSNSVCEAQIIGLPVISTNVGGISSLIKDFHTGLLVPTNDPFLLCSKILMLYENKTFSMELGKNARECALKRHDKETIKKNLLEIYLKVYNTNL